MLTVRHVFMGPGASIGGRNVITNLNELRSAEGDNIGSGNMMKGWRDHPTQKLPERNPSVYLAEDAPIASYHYIDCVGSPSWAGTPPSQDSARRCSPTRST